MLSVVWATATNAMSEVTTVDASLLEMIPKAQAGVLKLMERRAKLTGLDAPEKRAGLVKLGRALSGFSA
jgi:hypothetical protein